MGETTKIEWTDSTWNPLRARNTETGKMGWFCEHMSSGCDFCYAEKMNVNTYFGNGLPYKAGSLPKLELFLDEKMLQKPLSWRKPRKIFVCSMTDLFGRFVKDEQIDKIFAVMALSPQHTFQILTKRPERMRDYCKTLGRHHEVDRVSIASKAIEAARGTAKGFCYSLGQHGWHLPNVWLGTSCEDQKTADQRLPWLIETPAAVRWVSAEPLLSGLDLRPWLSCNHDIALSGMGEPGLWRCDVCYALLRETNAINRWPEYTVERPGKMLEWIVAGGESGPKARPAHPDWFRSIRDQCVETGTKFLFKQFGEWSPVRPGNFCAVTKKRYSHDTFAWADANTVYNPKNPPNGHFPSQMMYKVGKKKAGRLLDGREWSEFPQTDSSVATTPADSTLNSVR
jgi:protein gp37